MRFNFPSYEEELKEQKEWHLKFAWCPIRIDNTVVWLEFYERRIVDVISNYAATYINWEYRLYNSNGKDAM